MSDILLYIVAVLLAILESALYVWMLNRLLLRRWQAPIPMIVLCTILLQGVRFFLPSSALIRCTVEVTSDFFLCVCFFKGKPWRNIIYPIIYYDLMFACDSMTFLAFNFFGLWDVQAIEINSEIQVIMSLVSRLILPLLTYALVKVWPKKGTFSPYLYPIPIAFFVAQLLCYPYEYRYYHSNSELMFFLYFLFAALTLYCLVFIAVLLAKRRDAETKLKIMETQHNEQLQYVQEIQETYRGLGEFVHDARHHLDLIDSYVLRGDHEAAQLYIKTLYHDLGKAYINYTGNVDIDSIIFSKQMLCSTNGISFAISGSLPSSIDWLDTPDICVLLANGIQNAIDACTGIAKSTIHIEFKYKINWLLMIISNPIKVAPIQKNGRLISKKGAGHGYGISSMEAIATKYQGHLRTDVSAGIFTLRILLQRKTVKEAPSGEN